MTTPTPLRNPAVQEGLMTAVRLLMGARNPIATATADLLANTSDDMEATGAFLRTAFAGTDAEHVTVFDPDGHRIDWTYAYTLARTVIEEMS